MKTGKIGNQSRRTQNLLARVATEFAQLLQDEKISEDEIDFLRQLVDEAAQERARPDNCEG